MNPALSYIYARLSEPSTWRGIIALVTATGVALSPDQVDKIVAAGLALIGCCCRQAGDYPKRGLSLSTAELPFGGALLYRRSLLSRRKQWGQIVRGRRLLISGRQRLVHSRQRDFARGSDLHTNGTTVGCIVNHQPSGMALGAATGIARLPRQIEVGGERLPVPIGDFQIAMLHDDLLLC